MLIGYGRTSTTDQQAGIQAQERDLCAAGCDKLFIEQVSSIGRRQQLDAALDYVREGDTLIVTKLDRLARSVPDLLAMVAHLEAKSVALRVLAMSGSQPLDTGTAIGKLMLAVIAAVGQFEREMMLERQREGIAQAKRDGRYKGRAPTVQRRADEIIRLKDAGVTPTEIAIKLGIGRASVYRVLTGQHDGEHASACIEGGHATTCNKETTTMIGNEILRDQHGEKIGEVQTNGSKSTLRDKYGNPLGSYDSRDDFTRDLYGNPIGRGNLLVTLLR